MSSRLFAFPDDKQQEDPSRHDEGRVVSAGGNRKLKSWCDPVAGHSQVVNLFHCFWSRERSKREQQQLGCVFRRFLGLRSTGRAQQERQQRQRQQHSSCPLTVWRSNYQICIYSKSGRRTSWREGESEKQEHETRALSWTIRSTCAHTSIWPVSATTITITTTTTNATKEPTKDWTIFHSRASCAHHCQYRASKRQQLKRANSLARPLSFARRRLVFAPGLCCALPVRAMHTVHANVNM